MGKERDILRTVVAAVTATERVAVAIGMVIVHVMETVVAMEMDTVIQKAAAVMLMAIVMGITSME